MVLFGYRWERWCRYVSGEEKDMRGEGIEADLW